MKSAGVEAQSPAPIAAATATKTQTSDARVKRDRDEACSDRGCGRYLKERGSGRIERHKERGSGRINTKSAQIDTPSLKAKVTQVNPNKCHRGSGRCNIKFMEPVTGANRSIS